MTKQIAMTTDIPLWHKIDEPTFGRAIITFGKDGLFRKMFPCCIEGYFETPDGLLTPRKQFLLWADFTQLMMMQGNFKELFEEVKDKLNKR